MFRDWNKWLNSPPELARQGQRNLEKRAQTLCSFEIQTFKNMFDGLGSGELSAVAGRSSGVPKRNNLYPEGTWQGTARISSRTWSHLLAVANTTCSEVPSGLCSCSGYVLLCNKLPQNLVALNNHLLWQWILWVRNCHKDNLSLLH